MRGTLPGYDAWLSRGAEPSEPVPQPRCPRGHFLSHQPGRVETGEEVTDCDGVGKYPSEYGTFAECGQVVEPGGCPGVPHREVQWAWSEGFWTCGYCGETYRQVDV